MSAEMHTHGQLKSLCTYTAEVLGWKVKVENIDVDPLEQGLTGPMDDPGRGDVVLRDETSGAVVSFEYHLPEDVEAIQKTIREVIKTNPREKDRLRDPGEAARPLVIGD